jgi:hypothetical protein
MLRKSFVFAISNFYKRVDLPTLSSSFSKTYLKRMTTSAAGVAFPVKAAIEAKLTEALEPSFLEVINESHMHKV